MPTDDEDLTLDSPGPAGFPGRAPSGPSVGVGERDWGGSSQRPASGPGDVEVPLDVAWSDIAGAGIAGGGLTSPVPVVPAAGARQGRDWLPPPMLSGRPSTQDRVQANDRVQAAHGPAVVAPGMVPGDHERAPATNPGPVPYGLAHAGHGITGPAPRERLLRLSSRMGVPHGTSRDGGSGAGLRARAPGKRSGDLASPGRAVGQGGRRSGASEADALVTGPLARRAALPAPPVASPGTGTRVRLSDQLNVLPPWSGPGAARRWGWEARLGLERTRPEGEARGSSARNAAVMASGTALSRLTGFARVVAVGWVLGQSHLADAYNQANTVPNTVYDLLLGGVLSATLLPVLMQSMSRSTGRRSSSEEDDTVPAVVTFLSVVLVVATGVFWLAAPYIIDFFLVRAHGSSAHAEKELATTWLRLFTPQLFFIGLITITTTLLNARRRFMAVAFSPVLANVATIAALVVADHMVHTHSLAAFRDVPSAVLVVGLGTTAGYAVQLVAQLPPLFRASVPLRFAWRPRHPVLKAIARLSGWTVGAVVANQASLALVSVLANGHPGNYSSFTYAYNFMLLPYSVIAVSIAIAVAPELAELWSRGEERSFGRRVSLALRATLALMLPAGTGYALLARRVMVLAMAHGSLGVRQAANTGTLLAIFAVGLPGFSCYLLMMRAFQSRQDARSMFWMYVLENLLTVVAALALYPFIGVSGLVVAWMGSYTAVLPVVWLRLRRSVDIYVPGEWWARLGLATVSMLLAVGATDHFVPSPSSFVGQVARLVLVVVAGAAAFVLGARVGGLPELAAMGTRLRGRLPAGLTMRGARAGK